MRLPASANRITTRAMHAIALENILGVEPTIVPPFTARPRPTRHILPSAWYRAGTSKGLFVQRQYLPQQQSAWDRVILSAMGSQEGDAKQLNGLGGGSPTTSKVAVVARSQRDDVDLEYTFVQVVPDSGRLDTTGNCGNIASGVGPYALDEGLIKVPSGQKEAKIRILNTNTNKVMEAVVQLDSEGHAYEHGQYCLPGLASTGSPIELSFINPSGSMTGKTLPTGNKEDWLEIRTIEDSFTVRTTMVDVANPFVLVDQRTMPEAYMRQGPQAPESLRLVEAIRRTAAVHMGLAKDTASAALTKGTPKIAVLSSSSAGADLFVTSFSTGRVHPSLQLTGAVCISAAASIPDTVAWDIASRASRGVSPSMSVDSDQSNTEPIINTTDKDRSLSQQRKVTIAHAIGKIDAAVSLKMDERDESASIESVTVIRTARRLFEGNVFYDM